MRPRPLVPVLAVLCLLAFAPGAHAAATVFQAEGGGVFVGGDDTIDLVFVSTPNPSTIRVRSGQGPISSGDADCTQPSGDVVECPVTALAVEVAGGGESDVLDVTGPIAARLFGGEGDDVLRGGTANDLLGGEGGDDQLFGRAGDDDLRGDDGNDRLDGEQDSDLVIGGLGEDTFEDTGSSGIDSVSYKVDSVQSGVRVTIGDGANDGRDDGLEKDNVRPGFERIQGSNFDDVLRGDASPETINGSGGNDDIDGGGGADTIEGNGGSDILRAQDGVADARLECDSPSDPAETVGGADQAFLDAAGTDPDPRGCETVTRPAAGGGGGAEPRPPPPGPPAPRNTARPVIAGVLVAGQRVFCSPGSWTENPTFEYSWFVTGGPEGSRKVGDGPDYSLKVGDGGRNLACVVVARGAGQSSAATSPFAAVLAGLAVPAPPPVKRDFPDFTAPTRQCGPKGYCEADEARRKLESLGFVMNFRAVKVEGLRRIPRELREKVRPGQVFKTSPRPGAGDVTSSLADPLKVKLTYYVPNPERDCPIGETVEVRGGRDYRFNDVLVGLSLRDAVRRLKAERCSQSDYEVDYRFRKRSGDPVVSRARTVDDTGRDQVRLTVDHGAPDLQIGFVGTETGDGRLPLRLGDAGNEMTLVTARRQETDFTVHVGLRTGGIGFRRLRVELRDPGENLVDVAFTDGQGRARFPRAKITDDGTYELWASHTDAEGDAIVGWKMVKAKSDKDGFAGYDGRAYRYAGGRYAQTATAAAHATAAADGETVAAMRRQALRVRAGLPAFRRSAEGQATFNRLSDAQLNEVGNAFNLLQLFGESRVSLEQLIGLEVRPSVATLGGTQSLGIGSAASVGVEAFAINGREISRQPGSAVRVGEGALGFVTRSGATLFADGSFFMQTAGGNGFRNGSPLGPLTLDVTRSSVAIDTIGGANYVGLIGQDGAGLVSDNGLGIISNDGASLVSGGAGNIVAGGAGNIISNDGASIVSAGAGNLIGQDGAGVLSDNGLG